MANERGRLGAVHYMRGDSDDDLEGVQRPLNWLPDWGESLSFFSGPFFSTALSKIRNPDFSNFHYLFYSDFMITETSMYTGSQEGGIPSGGELMGFCGLCSQGEDSGTIFRYLLGNRCCELSRVVFFLCGDGNLRQSILESNSGLSSRTLGSSERALGGGELFDGVLDTRM